MNSEFEQVDGVYYLDLHLSKPEFERLKHGEMVGTYGLVKGTTKRYYIGVWLKGKYEEEKCCTEKDEESDGRDEGRKVTQWIKKRAIGKK